MKKYLFAIILFVLLNNLHGQIINSIQLNGGIVFPSSGSDGSHVGFELIRNFNDNLCVYFSVSSIRWDRNSVHTDGIIGEIHSYSEDKHKLYPVNIGSKFSISAFRTIKAFLDLSVNYNYLKYNSYNNIIIKDPDTKEIEHFYPDLSSRKSEEENLLGFGVGLGLSNAITKKISILIECKRNSFATSWDNIRNNYVFNAGLVYNL